MNTWYKTDRNNERPLNILLAALAGTVMMGLIAQTAAAAWKAGDTIPDMKGFGLEGTIPSLKGAK